MGKLYVMGKLVIPWWWQWIVICPLMQPIQWRHEEVLWHFLRKQSTHDVKQVALNHVGQYNAFYSQQMVAQRLLYNQVKQSILYCTTVLHHLSRHKQLVLPHKSSEQGYEVWFNPCQEYVHPCKQHTSGIGTLPTPIQSFGLQRHLMVMPLIVVATDISISNMMHSGQYPT